MSHNDDDQFKKFIKTNTDFQPSKPVNEFANIQEQINQNNSRRFLRWLTPQWGMVAAFSFCFIAIMSNSLFFDQSQVSDQELALFLSESMDSSLDDDDRNESNENEELSLLSLLDEA